MLGYDVASLTDVQLDALLNTANYPVAQRRALIIEKARRGKISRKLVLQLEWNKHTVKDALQPFVEITSTVVRNRRTRYSEAGGRKIGRPKGHPDKLWIDSYTAIKTAKLNATFSCHVARIGDEPIFTLTVQSEADKVYSHLECEQALKDWEEIARQANEETAGL